MFFTKTNSAWNARAVTHATVVLIFLAAAAFQAYSQKPAPSPLAAPTPTESDVVKISTNLIQVDVTVVDERGRVVKDLRPERVRDLRERKEAEAH